MKSDEDRNGAEIGAIDGNVLMVARCEDCGGDAVFLDWPAGWIQCGGSTKFGTIYQSSGIAWFCPRCAAKRENKM